MGDRVEELAGKVLALLGICGGARSRESMWAVFPEYSDVEMFPLVRVCGYGGQTRLPDEERRRAACAPVCACWVQSLR